MVFLILHIGLDILHETLREFGEVVDVVQWVQDTVDETLRQLTCCSHLLQTDDLCRTFLYHFLQMDLVLLQFAQTELEESIGDGKNHQQVNQVHIPLFVEGWGDTERYADDVRLSVHGILCLHIEAVGAFVDIVVTGTRAGRPRTPFAVVHLIPI